MGQVVQLYLLGDEAYDFVPKLRALIHSKNNPILVSFFQEAFYTIRSEIGCLNLEHRATFPPFSSLADLLARQHEGTLSPVFQTALSCIYQLGLFISHHARPGIEYPLPSESHVLGLCTGSLAAAAICCSTTLFELLPAAVEAVRVALRFGLCIDDVRARIEPNSTASWSMVVFGLMPQDASKLLEEFAEEHHLPPASRPWVAAHLVNGSTISGPPSSLERLRSSESFKSLKCVAVPIRVPAHTGALFTEQDVNWILKNTLSSSWTAYTPHIPMISSATGKSIWAGNFCSLLEVALTDILTEALRWDKIIEELPQILCLTRVSQVQIIPISTSSENIIVSCLKSYLESEETITRFNRQSMTWPSPENMEDTSIVVVRTEANNLPDIFTGQTSTSKIAIIGMSGRFPEADDPGAFWDLLRKGLDVVKEVPPKRWNTKTHIDPTCTRRNTGGTPWGCWLETAGLFDPRFFGISPKEAPQLDPGQRVALMTTYEALEMAGIVPGATPSTQRDRFGVFHGVTSNDWMETNSAQDIDTYFIVGGNRAFMPGRINFCFDLTGPSYAIDTACSSSLAAIHLACNSLWKGEIDTAIAGGTNMINNPDGHAGLDRGFFLSRTGNCKPFDDNADGYCRAEGAGTVILKRLEDAETDGDPILAVIMGASTNHSAESDSITRPHVGAQKALFDKVLNSTGVNPHDVSYIEMHGTGTQVGDAVEMESVLTTFASDHSRRKDQPLYLGAAKANIGHGEGVSGVSSLVKVLLMMRENEIPPHVGIKPGSQINHNYPTDFKERNVHIVFDPTPWKRKGNESRKILINNFSAAGGNTALLIEDAPIPTKHVGQSDRRTSHVVPVSAKCAASLKGNVQSLIDYIKSNKSNLSLGELSYTTTARRKHYPHRAVASGANLDEIINGLQEALDRGDGNHRAVAPPKVFFAFTGQGSQYLGMGKQLFDSFQYFRGHLYRFDQLAQSHGYPSFIKVFSTTEGDIGSFTPIIVQLATTCMQMALARLWVSWGVQPSSVVGHSLGEYAALNVAGILSDSDTIYLVGKRAQLLQEKCSRGSHSMLAVHAPAATIEKTLAGKKYEIACINGPEDTVLGGTNEQISSLHAILAEKKFKMMVLRVPYAFHTVQVQSILTPFEEAAQGVTYNAPKVPVMCPLTSEIVTESGVFGPEYLARHCRQTVNMRDALLAAKEKNIISSKSVIIEIGPTAVVSLMVKATLGQDMQTFHSLQRNKDCWPLISAAFSFLYARGLNIEWGEFQRDFQASHKVLHLPAYKWDLKDYWHQYEGDWCLTRGDPLLQSQVRDLLNETASPPPKLDSTTVHRLFDESSSGHNATVIAESDFNRADLNDIAKGHQVNQVPLTTPSIYADMALTVGRYMLDRFQPKMTERLVNVSELVVENALIPHSAGPQIVRTLAVASWDTKKATCKFYSVDANGKTTLEHASCTILFTDTSQLPTVKKKVPDYLKRVEVLRQRVKDGKAIRVSGTAGYKMIGTLAQFHPDYRAIDEIILDSENFEACSTVSFGKIKKGGTFSTHPAHIDVLTQTAGFVMNCRDSNDLETDIFVNHGWKSFQVYEDISTEKSYLTYVRMVKTKGGMWEGDTAMLDGDRVVAYFKGVELKWVPRGVFRVILASADKQNPYKKNKAQGGQIAPAKPNPSPSAAKSAPASSKARESRTPAKPANEPSKPPVELKQNDLQEPSSVPSQATAISNLNSELVVSAMHIVSEETGIALDDLADDCLFADIGVDSLLSMVIASRFREELNLDLDLEFSIFIDLPAVKDLKDFLGSQGKDAVRSYTAVVVPSSVKAAPSASTISERPDITKGESKTEQSLKPPALKPGNEKSENRAVTYGGSSAAPDEAVTSALEIISEETGISLDDLDENCSFADIGVDSLLSMVIASRYREELGLDLDLEFSIFIDLPTVGHLKKFLTGKDSTKHAVEEDRNSGLTSDSSYLTDFSESDKTDAENQSITKPVSEASTPPVLDYKLEDKPCKPATSVILQGFPKTSQKTLFLLPDGSGSSSSYVSFPRLAVDAAIIGLNCPYARDPWAMKCNYEQLVNSYMNEIRRRQPHGPYHLGGWSSGGIMAFMVAERFIAQGEGVLSLIIIDSPVPKIMDKLPDKMYEFCDSIGLFGYAMGKTSSPVPEYLIPHFNATMDVLQNYTANPIPQEHRIPKVAIVWAIESVLDEKNRPPPELLNHKGIHFLLEKRDDYGSCGWETLLPGSDFIFNKIKGNHFTMMQKPLVNQVAKFIERALFDESVD